MRTIRQRCACIISSTLLASLLLAGCSPPAAPGAALPPETEVSAEPSATPELARDFTLQTLDGETVSLSDLRGQWTLLNFWATWCAPCIKEMPYLNQLAAEREMQVLGVNFNEGEEVVRPFVNEHGISFPILMQPDDITLLVYGVRGLPRTFVIAPDGTIAHTIIGQIDPARLDAWLDEQQVQRKTTG
jgi:peroxiredoxin